MLPNVLRNQMQNNFKEWALRNVIPVALRNGATNWFLQSIVLSSLILLGFNDLEGTNDQYMEVGAQHTGLEHTWN